MYQEALNNALAESIADFALKAGCRGQWVDPLLSLSLCRCCHLIMMTVPQYSLITMHRSMPNMTPALHDPSTTCSNRKGKKKVLPTFFEKKHCFGQLIPKVILVDAVALLGLGSHAGALHRSGTPGVSRGASGVHGPQAGPATGFRRCTSEFIAWCNR